MDTPRLPRFARLFVNDSHDIARPGVLETAVPAEMLARDEWAMLLDNKALLLPRALVEPIEHELALAEQGSWTLRDCVEIVARAEGEFRVHFDPGIDAVLVRPYRSVGLMRRGVLRYYLGRDDYPLERAAAEFAEMLHRDIAGLSQYEIRLIDGDQQPLVVASGERFLYRLDEKRMAAQLLAADEFEIERMLERGDFDYDAEEAEYRLDAIAEAARSQRPVVIALDEARRAILFAER